MGNNDHVSSQIKHPRSGFTSRQRRTRHEDERGGCFYFRGTTWHLKGTEALLNVPVGVAAILTDAAFRLSWSVTHRWSCRHFRKLTSQSRAIKRAAELETQTDHDSSSAQRRPHAHTDTEKNEQPNWQRVHTLKYTNNTQPFFFLSFFPPGRLRLFQCTCSSALVHWGAAEMWKPLPSSHSRERSEMGRGREFHISVYKHWESGGGGNTLQNP